MKLAGRFAVSIAALAIIFLISTSQLAAQPPGGGGFRGGRGGPGGPGGFPGGGGTLGLIQQQEVQQEIELSEDQESELRTLGETIRNEIRGEMQGMFQEIRDLSDEERQTRIAEIRARFAEINQDAETRMQKVLLPHQFDRLKQIDLQSRIQRGGAGALTEGELAETLGLSESQRDQIRDKAAEVQKELDKKISQLRIEARNQLLEVLTTEQRAKLESMMGTEFSLPEPQFGTPGGRGFGGRGGRGSGQRNNAPAGENSGN